MFLADKWQSVTIEITSWVSVCLNFNQSNHAARVIVGADNGAHSMEISLLTPVINCQLIIVEQNCTTVGESVPKE